jgi:amino acid transporter
MSGVSLATSGPASLLLAFTVAGVTMCCTSQALGELAVAFPIAASFSSWATRFLDPSWGFAIGWRLVTARYIWSVLLKIASKVTKCSYALQWLFAFPVQIVAASEVIAYWDKSLPRAIFVTLFITFILAINMLSVKGYGEAEYIFAIIKITAIIGFM